MLPRPLPTSRALYPNAERPQTPLTEVVKDTAADLVTLVTDEVKLARLELVAGARMAVGRVGWVALAAIPLLMAYLMGVAALAFTLSASWGWAGSLAATAVSQAILGGALLWARPQTPLESTRRPSGDHSGTFRG